MGEEFAPPLILRRLVNQGRLGVKSGQGFFPYAQPDEGWEDSPVKLETRHDVAIAWLDRPPANSISPEVVESLGRLWQAVADSGTVRVLIFASANPMLFCAGADIKAFARMDPRRSAPGRHHARAAARHGAQPDRDDRRRQCAGLWRRLRAGHGLRHPPGRHHGPIRSARDHLGSSPGSAALSACPAWSGPPRRWR